MVLEFYEMTEKRERPDKMPGADSPELDEGGSYIGYQDALNLVYAHVRPVGVEELPLDACDGRIAAEAVECSRIGTRVPVQ